MKKEIKGKHQKQARLGNRVQSNNTQTDRNIRQEQMVPRDYNDFWVGEKVFIEKVCTQYSELFVAGVIMGRVT